MPKRSQSESQERSQKGFERSGRRVFTLNIWNPSLLFSFDCLAADDGRLGELLPSAKSGWNSRSQTQGRTVRAIRKSNPSRLAATCLCPADLLPGAHSSLLGNWKIQHAAAPAMAELYSTPSEVVESPHRAAGNGIRGCETLAFPTAQPIRHQRGRSVPKAVPSQASVSRVSQP